MLMYWSPRGVHILIMLYARNVKIVVLKSFESFSPSLIFVQLAEGSAPPAFCTHNSVVLLIRPTLTLLLYKRKNPAISNEGRVS